MPTLQPLANFARLPRRILAQGSATAWIGIHFVTGTSSFRAFVGHYPSVRDEGPNKLQPRHPNNAFKDFKCPSQIFFGRQ